MCISFAEGFATIQPQERIKQEVLLQVQLCTGHRRCNDVLQEEAEDR